MSSTAETIGRIWCELLGTDDLEVNRSFFDAGADSLLATLAADAIASELDIVVSVHDVYGNPTIERLAQHIAMLTDHD